MENKIAELRKQRVLEAMDGLAPNRCVDIIQFIEYLKWREQKEILEKVSYSMLVNEVKLRQARAYGKIAEDAKGETEQ